MERVSVTCDAGITASTIVNNTIEEIARGYDTKVDVKRIKITEVGPYEDTADLLVTTTMTKKEYKSPIINARSSLTGIGTEKTKQQVLTES